MRNEEEKEEEEEEEEEEEYMYLRNALEAFYSVSRRPHGKTNQTLQKHMPIPVLQAPVW